MKHDISKALPEVFDKARQEIFRKLGEIKQGVLGGGSAVSLHLIHRRSFDFDIFFPKQIPETQFDKIKDVFGKLLVRPVTNNSAFLDVILSPDIHLHITHYPYPPLHSVINTKSLPIFDLKDLASDKAYTIGRRATWRDYVDMFFILKYAVSLETITKEAKRRFGGGFDEKLFLEQLVYFDDIKDFSISYIQKPYTPKQIKEFFEEKSGDYLEKKIT